MRVARPQVWVLVAAMVGPVGVASAADAPRLGLFVGSNGAPPGREALRHAEADARRMRDVFVELGQMQAADATVLASPDRAQLVAALEALAARASPEATVVFYYSGHADDRGLLLGGTELRHADLRARLDAVKGRLGVHIVDACRAGALTRAKGIAGAEPFSVEVAPRAEGQAVIASSAAFEDAQESDRLGGSFFTLHLASGLRGAGDLDGDGTVTLLEAYDYVYARTVESTRATVAGAQHPTYRYDLRGRGDTVLTWVRGDEATAWLALSGGGDYLVVDAGSGRVVAEVEARASGDVLALRPATYRVSRRDPDALWEGDVLLGAGHTEADAHLTRRVEYAQLVRKGGGGGVAHTVWVEGGMRGSLGAGIEAAPLARISYALHLPWVSVRPRVGVATNAFGAAQDTPRLAYDVGELTAGVELRRAIDLRWVTVSGGVALDALWLRQTERDDREPERTAVGFVAGALASLESPPLGPLVLSLTGELDAYSFPLSDADRAPTGDGDLQTTLTFRTTIGVGYAF